MGLVVALGATLLTQEGHKRLKGLKGQKGCCGLRVGGLDVIRGGNDGLIRVLKGIKSLKGIHEESWQALWNL